MYNNSVRLAKHDGSSYLQGKKHEKYKKKKKVLSHEGGAFVVHPIPYLLIIIANSLRKLAIVKNLSCDSHQAAAAVAPVALLLIWPFFCVSLLLRGAIKNFRKVTGLGRIIFNIPVDLGGGGLMSKRFQNLFKNLFT